MTAKQNEIITKLKEVIEYISEFGDMKTNRKTALENLSDLIYDIESEFVKYGKKINQTF